MYNVTLRHVDVTTVAVEKQTSITYSEYVSVAFGYLECKAHAPHYIIICGLSGSTIFCHTVSYNGTIFGKKLLNIKCVFLFSLQHSHKIFLIPRIIQGDTVMNVKASSCKAPVILVGF
jgi:hypothetical protein